MGSGVDTLGTPPAEREGHDVLMGSCGDDDADDGAPRSVRSVRAPGASERQHFFSRARCGILPS